MIVPLTAISGKLQNEYESVQGASWEGSPFAWIIRRRSSRQRGKIGEELVTEWCKENGLRVERCPDSDADCLIEGKRVEIKFSTLWEGGSYRFQQLRDQNYDYLLCLGVSPFTVHAWIMKKSEIPFDMLKHQHKGKQGLDTWWFSVTPGKEPEWLKQHGGTLEDVLTVLKTLHA
ncbi:MAG TPA: hypothetical protein VEB18_02265 [Candidatus Paceibacterota bacterium]|nr:hypothetical protein [Candidatus Paceibacterota bacterium]